jgi:Tol biopolymer transport system component
VSDDIGLRDLRQVTFGFNDHEHPAWAPDGRRLAYYSGPYGHIQLYVCDADGRNRRPLTCARGNHTQAAWSPDGHWVYFRRQQSPEAPWEIWRVSVEDPATQDRLLASDRASYKHPSPSPDGRWLAWFSDEGSPKNFHLWKGTLEGQTIGAVTQLTRDPGRNDCHPTWSPDGQTLTFHAYMGAEDASVAHIFVCDADGANPRRISDTEEMHKHPFFVGSQLIVHHTEEADGTRYLALRRVESGELVARLTSGKKNDKHPNPWVPARGATRIAFASKKRGETLESEGGNTYDIFWGELDGIAVRR